MVPPPSASGVPPAQPEMNRKAMNWPMFLLSVLPTTKATKPRLAMWYTGKRPYTSLSGDHDHGPDHYAEDIEGYRESADRLGADVKVDDEAVDAGRAHGWGEVPAVKHFMTIHAAFLVSRGSIVTNFANVTVPPPSSQNLNSVFQILDLLQPIPPVPGQARFPGYGGQVLSVQLERPLLREYY